MQISTQYAGNPPRAQGKALIHGAMTIYDAMAGKNALLDALSRSHELEIDLSGVTEIDTAGIQLFVMLKRAALSAQKQVRFVAHSPATLEVFDQYDLTGYFGDPVVLPSEPAR